MFKLKIAALIIVISTLFIGGFWLYQKSVISDLNDTIIEQNNIITATKTKLSAAESTIESLNVKTNSLEDNIEMINRENKELNDRYKTVETQLTTALNKLNDAEANKKLKQYLQTEKSSLILRLMDKKVKCEIENFDKTNGSCIRGTWVENGSRLVPEESGE